MNPVFIPRSHETSTIIAMAGVTASEMRREFICTEHLLLAMTEDHQTCSEITDLFSLDIGQIRKFIFDKVPVGEPQAPCAPRLSPRSKNVLALALKIAKNVFGFDHVLPIHLFLGILEDGNGWAALAMKDCGLTYPIALSKIPMQGDLSRPGPFPKHLVRRKPDDRPKSSVIIK